jgi:hypothetical protein
MLRVVPYDAENLYSAMSNPRFLRSHDDDHLNYLDGYLRNLGTKWMVIEENYVDRDYLDDYANYYSKCFRPYGRFCTRLHFFRDLDESKFISFTRHGGEQDYHNTLQNNYLGFVVVKPLPVTVIGKTLLTTYPDTITSGPEQEGQRTIRCVEYHTVHLGGLMLRVNSIPFQEQDSVTAACATSAIWSALQRTAPRYGYYAPTPFEITKAATRYFGEARPFPNTGLNVGQMCRALISYGLEPDINEYLDPSRLTREPKNILLAYCYSYLRAGLPIIALVELEGLGDHAMTLTGYRIGDATPWDEMHSIHGKDYGFFLRGSRISQLYAHDDQCGPFTKIIIKKPDAGGAIRFETDWKDTKGRIRNVWPYMMVTPVYKKIRIPVNAPLPHIFEIHRILDAAVGLRENGIIIEWDAYLAEVASYKAEMLTRHDLDDGQREGIMETPFPRFFWRYRAMRGPVELMEVLADATDLEHSFQLFHVNYFRIDIYDGIMEALASIGPGKLRIPQLHPFLQGKYHA